MSKLLMTGTEAIDMWLIKLQIPRFRRIKETNLLGPSQVQFLHDDHCTILLPMFYIFVWFLWVLFWICCWFYCKCIQTRNQTNTATLPHWPESEVLYKTMLNSVGWTHYLQFPIIAWQIKVHVSQIPDSSQILVYPKFYESWGKYLLIL